MIEMFKPEYPKKSMLEANMQSQTERLQLMFGPPPLCRPALVNTSVLPLCFSVKSFFRFSVLQR